jgi:hypothetical protein
MQEVDGSIPFGSTKSKTRTRKSAGFSMPGSDWMQAENFFEKKS